MAAVPVSGWIHWRAGRYGENNLSPRTFFTSTVGFISGAGRTPNAGREQRYSGGCGVPNAGTMLLLQIQPYKRPDSAVPWDPRLQFPEQPCSRIPSAASAV